MDQMNGGLMIFFTFVITIIVSVAIRYFLWKLKVKDRNSIAKDWADFELAVSKNDVLQIGLIGDKLVWNTCLEKAQLTEMIKVVHQHLDEYPALKELSLNLFNKELKYTNPIPPYHSD